MSDRTDSSGDWPPPPAPFSSDDEPALDPAVDSYSGPTVSVSYQLTQDEVVAALRWELVRNRRTKFFLACGVFVVLCAVLLVATDPGNDSGWGLLGAGGYLLALGAFMVARGPYRSWNRGPGIRGPQSFTLSDSGVEAHSAIAESKARWDLYTEAYETPNAYLLRLANRRSYYIFPKRVFRSPEDESTFRNLVTQHAEAHLR